MGKPNINNTNTGNINLNYENISEPTFHSRGQRIQTSIKEYNNRSMCDCQFKDVIKDGNEIEMNDTATQPNKNDKDENEKGTKRKYKKILEKFAENTTAHGFGQIINSKSTPVKIGWTLIMLVAFVVLCIAIQPLFSKYLSKPTITKIHVRTDRQPNFPVIVICNRNMVKDEKYKELLEELGETEDSVTSWEAMLKAEKRRLYGHTINETIIQCSIHHHVDCTPTGDKVTDAKKGWVVFWHWKFGSCNAFNTGSDGENGSVELHKSSRIGPSDGLHLIVNVNQKHYRADTESAGIRLYVGNQGVYYSMTTQGMPLGPGQSYDAVIRKRVIKRVDPFENNTCMKDTPIVLLNHNTRKRISYSKYSSYLCESLCASETVTERCGCVEYSLPLHHKHIDLGICNKFVRETCVENIMELWDKGALECSKGCSPGCKETLYNLDITSQLYPSTKKREEILKSTNEDPRENLMKLHFFYRDMQYDSIEDELYYGISNLFADIGGQMGLFNGFSFLTVFEFIFLFFYVIGFSLFICIRGD